jgi:hypothetical protein
MTPSKRPVSQLRHVAKLRRLSAPKHAGADRGPVPDGILLLLLDRDHLVHGELPLAGGFRGNGQQVRRQALQPSSGLDTPRIDDKESIAGLDARLQLLERQGDNLCRDGCRGERQRQREAYVDRMV